jgi:hypothetical protein
LELTRQAYPYLETQVAGGTLLPTEPIADVDKSAGNRR